MKFKSSYKLTFNVYKKRKSVIMFYPKIILEAMILSFWEDVLYINCFVDSGRIFKYFVVGPGRAGIAQS